jgi:hypothetical protein
VYEGRGEFHCVGDESVYAGELSIKKLESLGAASEGFLCALKAEGFRGL